MVIIIIILLINFGLLKVNYDINRSIKYPPFLFSAVWFLILFLYFLVKLFVLIEFDSLSLKTLTIVTLGNLTFCISGILASLVYQKLLKQVVWRFSNIEMPVNSLIDKLLILLPLFALPFKFYFSIKLASESEIDNFFIALRTQLNYGASEIGILKYFTTIAFFNYFYRLIKYFDSRYEQTLKGLLISLFIGLVYATLATGRTFFFLIIISSYGIFTIYRPVNLKVLFRVIFISLAVFIIVGLILGKGGSMHSSVAENIYSFSQSITRYLIGGVGGLNSFLEKNYELSYGKFSFRFFYVILNNLNLTNTEPVPLIREYSMVPFKINVYTVYYQYILDFGIMGVIFITFLIGFFHSLIYYKAKTKNRFFVLFYALLLYPLLTSFFQDQYFSLLSTWIQYFILAFIVYSISGKKYVIRKD